MSIRTDTVLAYVLVQGVLFFVNLSAGEVVIKKRSMSEDFSACIVDDKSQDRVYQTLEWIFITPHGQLDLDVSRKNEKALNQLWDLVRDGHENATRLYNFMEHEYSRLETFKRNRKAVTRYWQLRAQRNDVTAIRRLIGCLIMPGEGHDWLEAYRWDKVLKANNQAQYENFLLAKKPNMESIISFLLVRKPGQDSVPPTQEKDALAWLEKAVESVGASCIADLGDYYLSDAYGTQNGQSKRIGKKCYEIAAEAGDEGAKHKLVEHFSNVASQPALGRIRKPKGQGNAKKLQDPWNAENDRLRELAKQGHANAQREYGVFLMTPKPSESCVPESRKNNARTWFTQASTQQDSAEMLSIGDDFYHGANDVSKNQEVALIYYELAANAGDGTAALRMAQHFVQQGDRGNAKKWFQWAYERKISESYYPYAEFLLHASKSTDAEQDLIAQLLIKSAESGDVRGQCRAGAFVVDGYISLADESLTTQKAQAWLTSAMFNKVDALQASEAALWLGRLLECGKHLGAKALQEHEQAVQRIDEKVLYTHRQRAESCYEHSKHVTASCYLYEMGETARALLEKTQDEQYREVVTKYTIHIFDRNTSDEVYGQAQELEKTGRPELAQRLYEYCHEKGHAPSTISLAALYFVRANNVSCDKALEILSPLLRVDDHTANELVISFCIRFLADYGDIRGYCEVVRDMEDMLRDAVPALLKKYCFEAMYYLIDELRGRIDVLESAASQATKVEQKRAGKAIKKARKKSSVTAQQQEPTMVKQYGVSVGKLGMVTPEQAQKVKTDLEEALQWLQKFMQALEPSNNNPDLHEDLS